MHIFLDEFSEIFTLLIRVFVMTGIISVSVTVTVKGEESGISVYIPATHMFLETVTLVLSDYCGI